MAPVAACIMALLPGTALAAPGSSTMNGTAQAAIVRSLRVVPVSPLSFGQITRPIAAGTVVLDPTGTITTTGGVLTSTAIAQTATRGPGTFTVTGDPGRLFTLTLPTAAILRRGPRFMLLGVFRSNWTAGAVLNGSGGFALSVGGTLRVGANQTTGTYTGTYAVTVAYQ